MKLIKLGGAVVNQTPLAWETNKAHLVAAIRRAREEGVSILCLPEMAITGYGCEDAFLSRDVQETALEVLLEILPETEGMIVSVGLPVLHRKALFNCAALIVDGTILGFAAKQHLAGDGIHYEPRWFKAWPAGERATVEVNDVEIPIGDLVFEVGDVTIGFEICEDAWVANRTGGELSLKGVDIILNPSASHFAFKKHEVRKRFVLEGSRSFGVSYLYTNLVGNEAGRAIYDGGVLIASGGDMIAEGPRFSFADWGLETAVIDLDITRMEQSRLASHEPEVTTEDGDRIEVDFTYPKRDPEKRGSEAVTALSKEEEFTYAVSLSLYDYLRKSRSHGFVVSISGGADSAAVSALVAMSVRLGVADIGAEAFREKLTYIPGAAATKTDEALTQRLLTCVYQSTRNSSETTLNAAKEVAGAIGARFMLFDVDDVVNRYVEIVEGGLGRRLEWETDDVALQNIQARARAPGIWLLTNVNNALLLATSNRSEAAVGYATMDGDTCGGLSPIAGIDKAFLREWLRWMEDKWFPALSSVNVQQPTAELRPADQNQTDEGDLMPYTVLDAIERLAIRDKQSPLDCYRQMRADFDQYPVEQMHEWIERFFRLWSRNQWKRERYAPSFHLDDENLDPKTWCRFPILSGGFQRELEELSRSV